MTDESGDHRAARFALRHPLLVSLQVGIVIALWAAFLYRSVQAAAICGSVTSVLFLILWMPRYGPARMYVERVLDDH